MSVTPEQFYAYVRVQRDGDTNMMDINRVIQHSIYVLNRDAILFIMANYESLRARFGETAPEPIAPPSPPTLTALPPALPLARELTAAANSITPITTPLNTPPKIKPKQPKARSARAPPLRVRKAQPRRAKSGKPCRAMQLIMRDALRSIDTKFEAEVQRSVLRM